MTDGVFQPALQKLAGKSGSTFGPTPFRDYVETHELEGARRTPQYISLDFVSDLAPELREAGVMVLRLGRESGGRRTQFALVEPPDGVESFFLLDSDSFAPEETEKWESVVDDERMLGFHALPTLSETSLVNLGLAAGVMNEALGLDHREPLLPPATGRSTFTFEVRPHSALDAVFQHRDGQVEVDTLFAERRSGERVLFVIEAKTGDERSSIAKHKLAYPVHAVADRVPSDIEIIPVYLRVVKEADEVIYHVLECSYPDPRDGETALNELEASDYSTCSLRFDGVE